MNCRGIHCDGCGHGAGGGPGGAVAVIVLVLIIAAGIEKHGAAIDAAIGETIEIALWSVLAVAAAGIGVIAWRIRRRVRATRDRRISPRVRAVITDARAGRSAAEAVARRQLGAGQHVRAVCRKCRRPIEYIPGLDVWAASDGRRVLPACSHQPGQLGSRPDVVRLPDEEWDIIERRDDGGFPGGAR